MDEIKETLEWNETVARKFTELGEEISASPSVQELFEVLIRRMEKAFEIPFVWFSLIRAPQADALRQVAADSDLLTERLNLIDGDTLTVLLDGRTEPLLVNGDLRSFYRMLPPTKKFLFRSLAIVPFTLENTVVGSLNNGDPSPQRYRPDLETGLLAELAARISTRLNELLAEAGSPPHSPS